MKIEEQGKNSKRRSVPLTERAAEILKRRMPASGRIFLNAAGGPLSQPSLNQQHAAMRPKLSITDLDFVPHSFRHAYGTHLGESGADVFTIMKLMRHATLAMAQRYVHPTDEMKGLPAYACGAESSRAMQKLSTNIPTAAERRSEQNTSK